MFSSLAAPSTTSFFAPSTLVRLDFHEYYGDADATRDFAPAEFGGFAFTAPEASGGAGAVAIACLAALLRRDAGPRIV